jgi:hypothetical protein
VVDGASNGGCGNSLDQRGLPRDDDHCDHGAVERQDQDPDPIFVDGFDFGDTSAW